MAIPETCYRGGTLYITGRVLEDVDVVGWQPFIKFRNGVSLDPIPGYWSDQALRTFFFPIPKETTEKFDVGRIEYEIYIELPSDEVFVVSRGSMDVVDRL